MENIFDLKLTKDYTDKELDYLISLKLNEWVNNWKIKNSDSNKIRDSD
jgi:hypothetical protein